MVCTLPGSESSEQIKETRITVERRILMHEDQERYAESDPRHHTIKIRGMLSDIRDHLREDVSKVEDPRAEALFETTAEVLGGLITAYEHYERGAEEAWQD
jgi:hypothetical protein